MISSTRDESRDESHGAALSACGPDGVPRLLELLTLIGDAGSTPAGHFREAVAALGADAGVFLSCIRDDATRTSYRSLLACDPVWACEYAIHGWCARDPWLRHAIQQTEPVSSVELEALPGDMDFIARSAVLGFASALIVPAHTSAGSSNVGVLYLGSHRPACFDAGADARVRVLARALAMELHRWLLRSLRDELMASSRLTTSDLELLRHEDAGHPSKVIAAALNIGSRTVDCRFQRICAKLDTPDRRSAARIARLYGLLR